MFKELADVLDAPLAMIFSKSISTGKVPAQWKEANVSALHKKGDKNLANNYRPISLTCAACRILESIIADSLKDHVSDILFEGQHGFMSKKSTVTQLFESVENWVSDLDNNYLTDIIFIDFAKAFDSVSHPKLLSKLKSYKVQGNVLNWLSDYLSNRIQKVCIDGEFSDVGKVISGVPQGSVLSPLLFLLYINDLPNYINANCTLELFADDCKIFFAFKTSEIDMNKDNDLQIALNEMSIWAEESQLQIQPPKCGTMHLGKNNPNIEYKFGSEVIPNVTSIRDLGVLMNNKMTFEQHIENIVKSANRTSNMILRSFHCKKPDFMMQLFNTFVRSKLEYASPIWSPHLTKHINRIEAVQRRFTKRIPIVRNSEYTNRLIFLKTLSLEERRLHLDLTFLYKMLHGHFNFNWRNYFEFKSNRTRGHSKALSKKHSNKDTKKFSFAQRIVNVWNFLPEESVSAVSVIAFKKSLHAVNFDGFLKGGGLGV